MKKLIIILSMILLPHICFAETFLPGIRQITPNLVHTKEIVLQNKSGLMPSGLIFFKDYQSRQMANKKPNADYSLGNTTSTFTATDSTPAYTSKGLAFTTANDEVLTYATLNNRTAERETIFIKFTPATDFADDGVFRHLTETDTKNRKMWKINTGTFVQCQPNQSDTPTSTVSTTTIPLANITYVICAVFKHSSPYAQVYMNGISEDTDTAPDYISPAWGTNFYIGSKSSGVQQLTGWVAAVAIFNRPLSATEVKAISNLL